MEKLPDVWKIEHNFNKEVWEWSRDFREILNIYIDETWNYIVYSKKCKTDKFKANLADIPEITLEQFKKHVLMENNNKNKIISSEQAQRIIDIACGNWKNKLSVEWGVSIVLRRDIEIEEHFYKTMRKACTKEQHLVFDEIFGKDVVIPEKGTLVYVTNNLKEMWLMRFYSHYELDSHHCFIDQKKLGGTYKWNYTSLTNPLLEEPKLI